jgi:hypothetical protein
MHARTRKVAGAFLTGALMVTSAWAGASLLPARDGATVAARSAPAPAGAQVLAGAAKTSIAPRPEAYDGTWETRESRCSRLSEKAFEGAQEDPAEFGDHLAAAGSPWPENPNCIYMGGFGIGPMNPVT